MKKIIFFLTCILLATRIFSTVSYAQQCHKCIAADATITFLGIDYTYLNFGGSLDQPEYKVIETYIPAWNSLFEDEPAKYNIGKLFNLSNVRYDVHFFDARNKKVKDINTLQRSHAVTPETIQKHVQGLNFSGVNSPYAMFLVATDYNKDAVKSVHYLVIYNLHTKKIELLESITTKPGGFGFRNYWAAGFHNIFKNNKQASRWFK